jgi:hypothetical protein
MGIILAGIRRRGGREQNAKDKTAPFLVCWKGSVGTEGGESTMLRKVLSMLEVIRRKEGGVADLEEEGAQELLGVLLRPDVFPVSGF